MNLFHNYNLQREHASFEDHLHFKVTKVRTCVIYILMQVLIIL